MRPLNARYGGKVARRRSVIGTYHASVICPAVPPSAGELAPWNSSHYTYQLNAPATSFEALSYRIESWERTGRAWEEGEQEVLEDLEYCGSAEEAWVAARFIQSIRREIKEQIKNVQHDGDKGNTEGRSG